MFKIFDIIKIKKFGEIFMEFPMIAFELCGDNGSLKLIIDEVFIDGSGFNV